MQVKGDILSGFFIFVVMGRAFEFRKARKMKRWSAMAKTFTRIGKDIAMTVRDGGPNPETNSRLRAVIQNAKAANMPKDNIERAIKRASDKSTENYKEVLFEGYAPDGVNNAVFVRVNDLIGKSISLIHTREPYQN